MIQQCQERTGVETGQVVSGEAGRPVLTALKLSFPPSA